MLTILSNKYDEFLVLRKKK